MRTLILSVRGSLFLIVGFLGLALIADLAVRAWSAWEVVTTADIAKRDAAADKAVLNALQALRFERTNSLAALRVDSSGMQAARQKLAQMRSDLDSAMREIDGQASGFVEARLATTATAVRSEYRALITLRSALDDAFGKVDGRDATLADRWAKQADQTLVTLASLSTALGDRIKRLTSETRALVNIKNSAWHARSTVGSAYAILTQAVAQRRPLTAPEVEAVAGELGKADAHWASVQAEAHRSGITDAIRQNIATAQAAMFSDENARFRQSIRDGLVSGHLPVSLMEFQADNGVRQRTILTVATSAMDQVVAVTESAVARARREMMVMSAVILAALIVSLGGLAVTLFRVTRPLTAMQGAMSRLSHGDLAVLVPELGRRDEIGAMAGAVQGFKDSLIRMKALETETALARASAEEQRRAGMRQMAEAFERSVGGIVDQVSASSSALQATAQTMTTTATRTATQSGAVATAAEQASSNVDAVAVAAEELGASVREIGRQVDGSARLAGAAVAEAGHTAGHVRALTEATARIGDVVELISSIAAQTNLLALNATIEAARAGAAGRGFAVVAAEVKELAGQTAKATEEITSQIAAIQATTGQTATAIGTIAARIEEISGVATSIATAVEEQDAATQEIVRNIAQAAAGTGEVTGNIAGVAGAAEETGAAARQVLTSASELSRQSQHLGAEVSRFLATVRAA
ncbi:methyl-accepting chemotaxis protein [Methylobacterium terricola]|nr:HAMP domain-containing methyl-accepting chemotaxis protein [Methylobacterium terricola]